MRKILIAAPTYEKDEYALVRFTKALDKITYKEADILIVDNSDGNKYFEKLKQLKLNKKFTILKDDHKDTRISRIISSRNIIRDFFIKHDYDLLFFLDSDIVPPEGAIQKLLQADTDIASGVYLCNQKIDGKNYIQPVIYKPNDDGSVVTVTKEEIMPNKLMAVAVCGLGCCLIRRDVLVQIKFRPFSQSSTGGEDVAFCVDARKKGFKILADTEVKCEHLSKDYSLGFDEEGSIRVPKK